MVVSTIDHLTLFEHLSSGLTLVTGNSRLARVLNGQYSQWRIKRGDTQWQSPAIYSWDIWIDKLWEAVSVQGIEGTGRAVPGSQQLVSLWENVLRDDPRAQQLLRPESLATRLRDTRRLLVEWRLNPNHPAWLGDENENYTAFYHWNRAFDALCRQNHWIAPEDRSALLGDALLNGRLRPSANIGLLGFDEFNPGQLELITTLMETHNRVTQLAITPAESRTALWQSLSSKDELQRMARWVRYWFEKEPNSRIAVVVPDLRTRRQEVERHLAEILMPDSNGANGNAKPWNTSMGMPLARVPMIESAFDVLRLLDSRIDIQDIGRVLRTPWISGGISERNNRALLEKCLRDKYPRQLKLSEVRFRANEIRKYDRNHEKLPPDQCLPRAWNSPVMASMINVLAQFERDSRGARPPAAWAEAFDRLLSNLGWPLGSEAESNTGALEHSENWQAYQAWQDGLRELASLDATIRSLGRKAAINQLHQVCRERIFQPHTPPANIQVLGLYEVSGLRFDHLWVLSLHNDNWPPAAQPNPFIPGQLQQKAQLPQSSPQRELDVARSITRRLLETADDCVFSYPGQLDGEAVLPSPLLTGDHIETVAEVPGWSGDGWQATVNGADKPRIGPLLMPGPLQRGTARGGSSILKNQALCPFRAFASNRLGADGLETPVDGISPMLHGSLLHTVLEHFWKDTRTRETLLLLDEESLEARIRKHVDYAVNEERGLSYRPEFRGVESDRLARLAAAHLELEKTRDPFEVVGFEKEILQDIEGQTIRLVIDRIDRLPSGLEVIIDYKTGRVDPAKWFGDRPEDPQLPLYSISAETTPAAVAFAVIRDGECLYRGVATREGILPGLPPRPGRHSERIVEAGRDMPATIENWRQILHRLMAEFLAGEAAIDPRDGRKSCKNSYCELQSLCRIGELEQFQKLTNGEVSI
jgi:ATP-dependent helicase/nuclease subunit B